MKIPTTKNSAEVEKKEIGLCIFSVDFAGQSYLSPQINYYTLDGKGSSWVWDARVLLNLQGWDTGGFRVWTTNKDA